MENQLSVFLRELEISDPASEASMASHRSPVELEGKSDLRVDLWVSFTLSSLKKVQVKLSLSLIE